jgi:hypothetical protein
MHVLHKPPVPQVAAKAPALTYFQKQILDIITVGGAIGQYTTENGGVLPSYLTVGENDSSLVMCNTTCDPTTSQISSLAAYKANDVKLMTYVRDLSVPDEHVMYLVQGAACQKNGAGLGDPSASARSMVILYAATSGNTISQRCRKL